MRRALRLAVLYTLEALAALLALAIFAGGAILWRLAEGPVDAEILRASATEALLDAVGGDVASIDSLQISFDPALAALVVTARNVNVARAGGEVLVDADRVETALALDLFLAGRAAPVRIAAEGGAFSLVRGADGRVFAGIGGPEAVRATPAGAGPGPGLGALTSGLDPEGGLLSRLVTIDLRDVDLQLVDEVSDLRWRLRDARAALDLTGGVIEADLSGALITSAGLAPVALRLETGRELETFFVDLRLRDLVPAAAAPRRGPLARLSALDAPMALDLVFDASAEAGLEAGLLEVSVGEGLVRAGGRALDLRGARLSLGLDASEGVLEINTAEVDSDFVSAALEGRLFDFAGFDDALPGRARFDLSAGAGRLDLTPAFPEAMVWEGVEASGALDRTDLSVVFETLVAQLPGKVGTFEGRFAYDRELGAPAIALSGPVQGEITKADVLRHWPVNFALGARDWVRDSIIDGTLSGARLDIDIPPSAILADALQDEHLSMVFDFTGADVRYMSTMTPLYGLSGSAELRGDSLSLQGRGGAIGAIEIDTIFVDIPRFTPKGGPARFGGTGRGAASDFIALIDEPPLGIATTYGLDPASFEGRGVVAFEIVRPMLRSVPPEDMDYAVTGRFTGFGAPTGIGDLRLTGGVVDLEVDPNGFRAEAEADLAGARADLVWRETFGLEESEPSSMVTVSTLMSARDLDRLGLPLRRFLDGAVGVDALIRGRGLDFSSVELALDLGSAAVALPADLWSKPAGQPATARLASNFADGGAVTLDRFALTGQGVELQAAAALAADGRLLSADIDRLRVDGRIDVAGQARRPDGPDGALHLRVTGEYFDAGELFSPGGEGESFISAPLVLEAAIARVLIREIAFDGLGLTAEMGPEGLARASLAAQTRGGPVDLRFEPEGMDPAAPRRLTLRAADAGALLAAFAGYDNAEGGTLELGAVAPPLGAEGPVQGAVLATGFTLERMPLLARILAAGSLEGLAVLLSGQGGIEFERLQSDFVWQDGTLEMREARVAGPALGVTWTGVVDFDERRTDVDGTILPSYGANSILGSVPVVGELFTSRRGEGVFGVTFSAAGPFDAIRVVSNPLSALAPGVFRRIFEGTSAERELQALEAERRAREAAQAENPAAAETPEEPEAPDIPDAPAGPQP
ncbi:MAG: AsmA-like C-terminal region-containing protein [Oceanicaulis sp.]